MDPKERVARSIKEMQEKLKTKENKGDDLCGSEEMQDKDDSRLVFKDATCDMEETAGAQPDTLRSRIKLIHPVFRDVVMENSVEVVTLLLQVILGREDIYAVEVAWKRGSKNRPFRIIDVYAKDDKGRVYDIVIQNGTFDTSPGWARVYGAYNDFKFTNSEHSFTGFHDSYVIVITERDIIGAGLPVYHFERMCLETQEQFGDGSHIIYVNSMCRNLTGDIGRLIHDLRCSDPNEMYYEQLAKSVESFKYGEGWERLNSSLRTYSMNRGEKVRG